MGSASQFAALLLLFGTVGTAPAMGQTPAGGAYERLDAGHQKIARALFEAQTPNTLPGAASQLRRGVSAAKPLSLDEIAALKQPSQAWGHVFQAMRQRGLLREDNLAQVMSRYEHHRVSRGVVMTADRAYPKTRPAYSLDQ